MACSHFKCLISHCVLGTSVLCQPGPGDSVLGEGIPAASTSVLWLPELPVWPVASSLWLEPRPCLSINIHQNKAPSPGFGLLLLPSR